MSQAMRKLTAAIGKTNTIVIFINQLREKIGVMYGNPETTTGGRALKYYASVRIDIRRIEALKSGTEVIGNRTRAKVVKNKVAPPFKEAEFDIMFGEGISKTGEIVDIATKLGIINKAGAWYSYGDIRLGQGRDNTKEYFATNPEVAKEVEDKVFAAIEKARQEGINILSPSSAKKKTIVSRQVVPPAGEVEAKAEEKPPVTKRRSANIDIDVE